MLLDDLKAIRKIILRLSMCYAHVKNRTDLEKI